ncbi:hypothetical protein LX36DRAFT_674157 [Colletotrichum falcatum]|nr:hypothetical protein LX36DRAFT_674157 [Colletotrichum falcatum]
MAKERKKKKKKKKKKRRAKKSSFYPLAANVMSPAAGPGRRPTPLPMRPLRRRRNPFLVPWLIYMNVHYWVRTPGGRDIVAQESLVRNTCTLVRQLMRNTPSQTSK